MLEAIRNHAKGWIAKIILVLISIPFVLFGLESYFSDGAGDNVLVEIDKTSISRPEFDQEIQTQTQRLRERLGESFDPALVQTEEFKQSVLDGLIERRVLAINAQDLKLVATHNSVARVIAEIPAFKDNETFSPERYQAVLKQNGRSPAQFENEIRSSIMTEMATGPVTQAAFSNKTSAELMAKLVAQQREVAWVDVAPSGAGVNLTPAEIKAYYDKNTARFAVPAALEIEYVTLSLKDIEAAETVDAKAVSDFYAANRNQFGEAEQRSARHILVAASSPAEKTKARARADALYKTLLAKSADFETLARTQSDDPVAAEQGGSLGSFGRGTMAKPFEDAVFAMKVGELRGPVETDFGYHIIRLDGITPANVQPLETVRVQIEEQLRKTQAQKAFPAIAENFSNLVYENADNLQAAAQSAKLAIQKTGWVTAATLPAPLNNPRLAKSLFAADAIKSRQNIEAVEVAPGELVAARVVNHRPRAQKPLTAVQTEVEALLRNERLAESARKLGEARISELRAGKEAGLVWSPFRVLNRQFGAELGAAGVKAAFTTSAAALPGYSGYALPDGSFRILRVSRVLEPPLPEQGVMKSVTDAMQQATQTADLKALLAELKSQHAIIVRKNALETE